MSVSTPEPLVKTPDQTALMVRYAQQRRDRKSKRQSEIDDLRSGLRSTRRPDRAAHPTAVDPEWAARRILELEAEEARDQERDASVIKFMEAAFR